MRPRTKLQFEVLQNSKYLNSLSKSQEDWAFQHCFEHRGFQNKTRVICMDCGESFSPSLVSRKRATCPQCDTKLTNTKTLRRTDSQHAFFAIAEIYGEFQVIRNFEMYVHGRYGKKKRTYINEILQHWIIPNGKREVIALNHRLSWHSDAWTGNLEIRDKSNTNKYDVYPLLYHPDSEFDSYYTRYGIDHTLQGLTFLEAIKMVPGNPKAETLLKAKQHSLLNHMRRASYDISRYWPSFRILMRNRHKVKDAGQYIDYLELLRYFRLDLHSTKYLIPKNLKKEHDRLVAKKRERQKKEELELKRKRALRDESFYQTTKKPFIGLEFSENDITVRVLESVHEFMEVGDKLKHCVFTNEYYLKVDSLILSALVNNEVVETVEVSLKTMEIVQSRGMQNKATEYNEAIVSLVKRNMFAIKAIHMNAKREAKAVKTNTAQVGQFA